MGLPNDYMRYGRNGPLCAACHAPVLEPKPKHGLCPRCWRFVEAARHIGQAARLLRKEK